MNAQQYLGGDWVSVIEKPNLLAAKKSDIFSLRDTGHTAPSNRIRFGRPPTPSEKNICVQQDKPTGTNFSEVVRVMPQTIQQDTFLDDDVGDTIKFIKNRFGDAPLVEAYEAALDTFKEPDRRWKEYLDEEEAKFRSIFEVGEDRDL
jgi:hypothetical protein